VLLVIPFLKDFWISSYGLEKMEARTEVILAPSRLIIWNHITRSTPPERISKLYYTSQRPALPDQRINQSTDKIAVEQSSRSFPNL
jgi:hypothetical protein